MVRSSLDRRRRLAYWTYERGLKDRINLIRNENLRILCKMHCESHVPRTHWLSDENEWSIKAGESISLQICHENSQKPTPGDSAVYAAASVGLVLR